MATKADNQILDVEVVHGGESQALAVAPEQGKSLMSIIDRAVSDPTFDVTKLMALLDVKERWDKTEARKAFVAAMKKFKAAPPTITKNKKVHFDTAKGPTDYRHATLDHVCDVVTKGLSDVGITHAWKVRQEKDVITVICILTHELGHSEETELMGCHDNSGGKNAIQAVGSTVTYLQRYTLLAACGLAAQTDTDGQTAAANAIDAKKVEDYCRQMNEVEKREDLSAVFKKAFKEAAAVNDLAALARYTNVNDRRKKELEHANG